MSTIHKIIFAIFLFFALPLTAAQASIDAFKIDGNEASASISLPGGIGAELVIRFESVIGLSAEALNLSAELIDPLSPDVLGALPNDAAVSIPSAFPVLLVVAAPASGGLAFEGLVEIELYTRNLHYSPDTTLRLFSSSEGQPFRDITDTVAAGSYRVRGSSGEWSEFLILADDRPLSDLVEGQFTRLDESLAEHSPAMDATVANELDTLKANAYMYWQAGDIGAAVEQIRLFGSAVQDAANAGLVPDVWRSSRDLVNVAGRLRANARVLGFTLGQAMTATSL